MAVKYGYKRGGTLIVKAQMGASEVLKENSGRFVKADANKYMEVAGSGNGELTGWIMGGEFTCSSTDGKDILDMNIHPHAIYLIPADAAVTTALLWETCDLIVSENIQYADVGENNEAVIQIVGVDAANQAVYVRLNPNKMFTTGVI
jgi:hypothetical protein